VETDRVVLDPVSRKGADLAVTGSDPEEGPMSKAISGLDIVTFAMSLKGKPYKWAGVSPKTGFDCSGYTYFVYRELGIDIARSSRAQYKEGIEIDEKEARKGDLIFFRGTNPTSKQIGHVGIVISEPGEETVRFVHSSTGRGVVEDSLERTNYRRRYIGVKRVL
ncbi:MAG: C40 family peptidase, partial [Cyclobacteriaceae bacterium]